METLFETTQSLLDIKFVEDADSWHFTFTDGLNIRIDCLWRINSNKGIEATSKDHKQTFTSTPFDSIAESKKIISNASLISVQRRSITGDLVLNFNNKHSLEAIVDSSGYECWEICYDGQIYVGLGAGDITTF